MAGAAGKLGSKLAAKLFDAFSETMTDAAAKSQSKKAAESIKKGKELNKKAANAIKNLGNTKREREIKKLFKEGQGEGLGETKQAKIQIDPDTGRPTSKVIALWDQSNRAGGSPKQGAAELKKLADRLGISVSKLRERLINTGFAKETGDGKLFSTGKYTRDVSDIAESMGLTQTGDLRKLDQEALKANIKKGGGFQIEKKTGGPLKPPPNPGAAALPKKVRNKMGFLKKGGSIAKRKAGGRIVKRAIGGGVALRGHGAVRKI
tara:strand:+ start:63 stop:851 length:789 start_codon:yes stop_codon:yes gene_type:complete